MTQMKRPLVSVVMAIYNGAPFLEKAIESIVEQSFDNFELILVDDGSEDGSLEIAESFEHRDRRIRVVPREHSGLVTALNLGCSLATGEYIARLDSDDIAKPWRLEEQVMYLTANRHVVLLGGSTECIDQDGKVMFVMRWPGWNEGLRDYLLLDCHIAHTTIMFKREVFMTLGGYRACYEDTEDYDLFLRLSDRYTIDNLPVILCQYRIHEKQVSVRKAHQQILSGIGARLATQARRANCPEPHWENCRVGCHDLVALGVKQQRIDSLTAEYRFSDHHYRKGWRWSRSRFLEIAPEQQNYDDASQEIAG
jgi:glycosyltransferase involved in cell wall biosynthesis